MRLLVLVTAVLLCAWAVPRLERWLERRAADREACRELRRRVGGGR